MNALKEVFGNKPVTEPIFGREDQMTQNNEGGYSFKLDNWKRLERFLVLGTDSGSFYANARTLSIENARVVLDCLSEDLNKTIDLIEELGTGNRVIKQNTVLFAFAMALSYGLMKDRPTNLDIAWRDPERAKEILSKIVRKGTHLLNFVGMLHDMRGFGRSIRNIINHWYLSKDTRRLAYQCLKYQSRDGWSHRDVLRLTHPNSGEHNPLFHWITKPDASLKENTPALIHLHKKIHESGDKKDVITTIENCDDFTREMVPTEYLKDPDVQRALLKTTGTEALTRNLANLTRIGVIKPLGDDTDRIVKRLTDPTEIKRSRMNPIHFLSALTTYSRGRGERGKNTWEPVHEINNALSQAFELSFGTLPKLNKRIYVGMDVSYSMERSFIAGIGGMSADKAAVALGLIFNTCASRCYMKMFNHELVDIKVGTYQETLNNLRWPGGWTDCSLPMTDAINKKLEADAFIVLTDAETGAVPGRPHPIEELRKYRKKSGINAKLIVVGMVSNGFTIADPNDAHMLDVVGFDSAVPNAIQDFINE